MKTVKDFVMTNGVRRVTVDLAPGEQLMSVLPDTHYRMGYPLEDVVPSHVVCDSVPVHWCCLEQKWVTV